MAKISDTKIVLTLVALYVFFQWIAYFYLT